MFIVDYSKWLTYVGGVNVFVWSLTILMLILRVYVIFRIMFNIYASPQF